MLLICYSLCHFAVVSFAYAKKVGEKKEKKKKRERKETIRLRFSFVSCFSHISKMIVKNSGIARSTSNHLELSVSDDQRH